MKKVLIGSHHQVTYSENVFGSHERHAMFFDVYPRCVCVFGFEMVVVLYCRVQGESLCSSFLSRVCSCIHCVYTGDDDEEKAHFMYI